MSWFRIAKRLVPPTAVPLALSMFVALAGPGGIAEVNDDGGGEAGCFLTVLKDGADSYMVLQEHVSDPEMPQGGVAGNQNALDRICFGTVDGSEMNTTLVPGNSDDAPGKSEDTTTTSAGQTATDSGNSEDAPGNSEDTTATSAGQTATDPGKSEEAPGEPTADGQAQGQGQANADGNGNGAADAPGHNKP